MPRNANKGVYKEKEFQTYAIWKSLPPHIRGLKKEQLKSYGFTDPLMISISKIKTQTEFAKYFRIKDLGTLTDWNTRIRKNELANDRKKSTDSERVDLVEPAAALQATLKEQLEEIDRKISMTPNSILEKKIERLQKTIMKLKKEKSGIDTASIKKDSARKSQVRAMPESEPSPSLNHSPENIQTAERDERETLSKKIRRIFGW